MSSDFTSALFLGLRHADGDLPAWTSLTTGRPPALDPGLDADLASRLARLTGTGDAVLRRTTLHGIFDSVVALAPDGGTVLVDETAYPISHWAAAAASGRGIHVRNYRHHDVGHAAALCRSAARPTVVLTDGWCSSCSRPAPLAELFAMSRRQSASVVVDDSLAMGVLGVRTATTATFGAGGGGLLRWLGLREPGAVVVASLAKGWGAPLAVVAGPGALIRAIRDHGESGIHASGPSAADRAALRAALDLPPRRLDAKRNHLAVLTSDLRVRLRRRGLRPVGLPFPFVEAEVDGDDAVSLVAELGRHGCRTLALQRRCGPRHRRSVIGMALRTDHTVTDLDRLERALDASRPSIGQWGAA